MKKIAIMFSVLCLFSGSLAHALLFTGAMDNRAGFPFVPGLTAQTRAWVTGDDAHGGLRLEWQADNETTPGSWTYTYRLLRGTARNKGFAFFDIETAGDFTAANITTRQVVSATDRLGAPIPSGLASITISDPVNFNAVHDFSNPALSETSSATALSKGDLSHYSGDPGLAAPGQPGGPASATPSVGPVPHPFYGIRVTFPGSFLDLAYEACEWEFRVVTNRVPMWGKVFGWGDQTTVTPFWYANFYNDTIDNPNRLALAPIDSLIGADPYRGWVLVPGALPGVSSTIPASGAVGVPVTEPVSAVFPGVMDTATITAGTFTLASGSGPVSGTVSYDQASKTATFKPNLLLTPNTPYTATIAAGVKDLAGNALTAPSVWSFTTSAPDTTAPTVTATLPGNGATYVATTTTFMATFSEAIDPTSLTPATFSVGGVSGTVGYAAATRTATFTPDAPLANNTTYTATIGTGVMDLAGNPLVTPAVWSVTTIPRETVLPFVISTFPAARAVNVVTTTTISATFSEPVDQATLTPATFFVSGVIGTTSYDPASRTATFTPAAPLSGNTSYTLTVTTGVRDLAGNPVGLTKTFTFATLNLLATTFSASGTVTGPGGTPLQGVKLQVSPISQLATSTQIVFTDASGHYSAGQLLNGTYIFVPSFPGAVFTPQSITTGVTAANVTGLNFTNSSVILTPDKASPQSPGTAVLFSADTGLPGYQFRFWLFNGANWSMVQDYGVGSTWTLPALTLPGDYVVAVDAKLPASLSRESVAYVSFKISSPATGVTLTPAQPSPHAAGTAVLFTAAGSGSSGYQYRFWLFNGTSWAMVQDYPAAPGGATWTMPAATPIGDYVVAVDVRTSTGVDRDAVAYLPYTISLNSPATGVTLAPDQPTPHPAGTAVLFTATGEGSVGYQFQFWLFDGISWSMVQDYPAGPGGATWSLPAATSPGNYVIAANVRTSAAVVRDAVTYFPYRVQ